MKNWCGYSVIRHHGVVIPCILCCQIGELVIYDIKLKSSYLNNCQVLHLYGRLDWFALVHDGKPKGHGGQLNSDFSFITGENIERIPEKQPHSRKTTKRDPAKLPFEWTIIESH